MKFKIGDRATINNTMLLDHNKNVTIIKYHNSREVIIEFDGDNDCYRIPIKYLKKDQFYCDLQEILK